MKTSTDQAFAEWNSLIQRERIRANRVRPYREEDGSSSPSDRNYHSCPAELREEICDWSYRVVDHHDIDRDVVSVALSYFDRYISCDPSIDVSLLKLAAATSLYLAIKVHSTTKLSAWNMSSMSQGRFSVHHILKMETSITWRLTWHLNPPIPLLYLTVAGPLIRDSVDEEASPSVEDLSRYILELSTCDGFFADKEPSSVAYAAIGLAMDVHAVPRRKFSRHALENAPETTRRCLERLRRIYALAGQQLGAESSPTAVY